MIAALEQLLRLIAEWRARRADRREALIVDEVREKWGVR